MAPKLQAKPVDCSKYAGFNTNVLGNIVSDQKTYNNIFEQCETRIVGQYNTDAGLKNESVFTGSPKAQESQSYNPFKPLYQPQ